ncbi:MAG: hypothetical protein ACK49R_01535 [Planctomycetota bacterium]|jgi:hypothetical protein
MTILKPLAIFALTPLLLNIAVTTSLPAQLSAPPQSAQSKDPSGGGLGPSVDWSVELNRNQEEMVNQSDKIAAQLTRLIDLRSEGELTIEEFVEMIQEAQGEDRFNVLIAEELRNTRLPSFDLRRIKVSSAFQMLTRLVGNNAIAVEIESAVQNETADLISISRDHRFTPDISVRTHPVKRILDTIKPEILLQTLEKGIQFSDAGSPKVQIALEAETGLLFVKGTPAQLDIVLEILNAIAINNMPVFGGMGGGMGGMGGGMGVPGGAGITPGGAAPSPNAQPTPPTKDEIQ